MAAAAAGGSALICLCAAAGEARARPMGRLAPEPRNKVLGSCLDPIVKQAASTLPAGAAMPNE